MLHYFILLALLLWLLWLLLVLLLLLLLLITIIRGETRASTIVTIPLKIPLQNGIR